jgi:hypothetical protein
MTSKDTEPEKNTKTQEIKSYLTHEISVLGKTVPTLAIAAIVMVGGASAAVLGSFGTVSGTADVDQAVELKDESGFSFANEQTAGETLIETRTLKSNANVTTQIGFKTTCKVDLNNDGSSSNSIEGNEADFSEDCKGIDTEYVEYYDDAGHDFSNYEAGYADGDDNVIYVDGSGSDIQDAIDNRVDGSTEAVLVADGTYDPITVNEDVTVVAENQGGATIKGGDIGISITANGATVRGFEVQAAAGNDGEPNSRGIDVLASDVTVKSNYIHSVSDEERPIGIHLWGNGQDVSNTKVINNRVEDVEATTLTPNLEDSDRDISKAKGIAVSGGDSANANNVEISHNTVKDVGNKNTALASAINIYAGAENFDVNSNVVGSVDHKVATDSPYDLGVYVSGYSNGEYGPNAVVTENNFVSTDSDQLDVATFDSAGTLNAPDNWFGTNGIQAASVVDASWKLKSDTTIEAGTTDEFGIVNEFAINLEQADYELTTDIVPEED